MKERKIREEGGKGDVGERVKEVFLKDLFENATAENILRRGDRKKPCVAQPRAEGAAAVAPSGPHASLLCYSSPPLLDPTPCFLHEALG